MIIALFLTSLATLDSAPARVDSQSRVHRFAVEVGDGYDTSMWRVSAQRDWRRSPLGESAWAFAGHVEIAGGAWYGHSAVGENRNLVDLGLTPVWRIEHTGWKAITPHAEAAVGFHYISETRINSRVGFGSAFQFGDHAGVGASFGEDRRYQMTFRFQHLSNGGIRHPNHGINFSQLRFAWVP